MAIEDKAHCRGCKKELAGNPYYAGGYAYDPVTRESAKTCFYGGWVCSRECDLSACLSLERTMPGHGYGQREPGQLAMQVINRNWGRS